MASTELIERAGHFLARRLAVTPASFSAPDKTERNRPAVDLVGYDDAGKAVLVAEHTLVQSYPHQRAVGRWTIELFDSLVSRLDGTLPRPGHYQLVLDPRGVVGLNKRTAHIRREVESWVRDTAPHLELGSWRTAPRHFRSLVVPGTTLEVTLSRFPHHDGRFSLVFFAPKDLEQARLAAACLALDAKCPKLAAAQAQFGCPSALLLELADFALSEPFQLGFLLEDLLRERTLDVPHHVLILDTMAGRDTIFIVKDGDRYFSQIEDCGPFAQEHDLAPGTLPSART